MTPSQQNEARSLAKAFLRWDCFNGINGPCVHSYMPGMVRLHDRARRFLKVTAPKKTASRSSK